ncbi:CDP-diacylglycerol--serine O-phosphatidyltransferase [Sulfobacillus acidophilus]|uniref:CDP-diacylglycerol--serine O-phosphatidyltransferase n=1 Tax=Sulfobacillus acidophilus TaxID=53633 RepID=A0ABS3AVU1_9FIRM|nr:CDP-diacylglycerol--serine O-phosphatidyltransferase [Sulfobacillus acidophilus]
MKLNIIKSIELKKALFILPNAFTLASVFCGFYAILHALSQNGPQALYQSSIAIFFAGFFDMFDGRVARLTKTQSEFGMQLDSLADVISFGVAPGVIVFKWALSLLGPLGFFVAFVYVSCGVIRLARFNVLATQETGPTGFFVGLPIPLAAATIVSLVVAHFKIWGGLSLERPILILCVVLLLATLMVSNVPYWTFKNLKLNKTVSIIIAFMALLIIAASFFIPFGVVLVTLLGSYIFLGIIRYFYLALGFRQA